LIIIYFTAENVTCLLLEVGLLEVGAQNMSDSSNSNTSRSCIPAIRRIVDSVKR
jgi:hypothetical protein